MYPSQLIRPYLNKLIIENGFKISIKKNQIINRICKHNISDLLLGRIRKRFVEYLYLQIFSI